MENPKQKWMMMMMTGCSSISGNPQLFLNNNELVDGCATITTPFEADQKMG